MELEQLDRDVLLVNSALSLEHQQRTLVVAARHALGRKNDQSFRAVGIDLECRLSFALRPHAVIELQKHGSSKCERARIAAIELDGGIGQIEGLIKRIADQQEPAELQLGIDVFWIELHNRAQNWDCGLE